MMNKLKRLLALPPGELFEKLRRHFWSTNRMMLLRRPAGKPMDEGLHKPCTGELRAVTEETMGDGANLGRDWPEYCRELLDRGDLVRYGYLDGKCVFRHVLRYGGTLPLSGREYFRLRPEDGYTHAGYCAPEARGKGLHAEDLWQVCAMYPDMTLYTEVKPENAASLRGCYRAGYEPVAVVEVDYRFFFRSALRRRDYTPEEARELVRRNLEGRG